MGLGFLRLTFNLNMCPPCAWAKGCVDKRGKDEGVVGDVAKQIRFCDAVGC